MKKAAIYCRVSTTKQSCDNQLAELREVAARSGWSVVAEFLDRGISGATAQRPALQQLRKEAARRRFEIVMVWDISRLGRSLTDLVHIMNEMGSAGVDLFFHQQAIDTTTATGKLCFQIFGSLAEWEREIIRERVRSGLDNARRKGIRLGRPSRMNESLKAAIVALRGKGASIRSIARSLEVGVGTVYRALGTATSATA